MVVSRWHLTAFSFLALRLEFQRGPRAVLSITNTVTAPPTLVVLEALFRWITTEAHASSSSGTMRGWDTKSVTDTLPDRRLACAAGRQPHGRSARPLHRVGFALDYLPFPLLLLRKFPMPQGAAGPVLREGSHKDAARCRWRHRSYRNSNTIVS